MEAAASAGPVWEAVTRAADLQAVAAAEAIPAVPNNHAPTARKSSKK